MTTSSSGMLRSRERKVLSMRFNLCPCFCLQFVDDEGRERNSSSGLRTYTVACCISILLGTFLHDRARSPSRLSLNHTRAPTHNILLSLPWKRGKSSPSDSLHCGRFGFDEKYPTEPPEVPVACDWNSKSF
eukprot:748237-Hanusia_phi.AAC.5